MGNNRDYENTAASRKAVFEREIGKRNYLYQESVREPSSVLEAMAYLIREMKNHSDERKHQTPDKQLQDYRAYATAFIDLLARVGITKENSGDFKLTNDFIEKSHLSDQEKKEIKTFLQTALTLYPVPVNEFTGGTNVKIKEVQRRIDDTFGQVDSFEEKYLLKSLGFTTQAEIIIKAEKDREISREQYNQQRLQATPQKKESAKPYLAVLHISTGTEKAPAKLGRMRVIAQKANASLGEIAKAAKEIGMKVLGKNESSVALGVEKKGPHSIKEAIGKFDDKGIKLSSEVKNKPEPGKMKP